MQNWERRERESNVVVALHRQKYLHHPAFLDGSLCTVAFFDL